jgi:hypothetical protein
MVNDDQTIAILPELIELIRCCFAWVEITESSRVCQGDFVTGMISAYFFQKAIENILCLGVCGINLEFGKRREELYFIIENKRIRFAEEIIEVHKRGGLYR